MIFVHRPSLILLPREIVEFKEVSPLPLAQHQILFLFFLMVPRSVNNFLSVSC